MAKNSNTAQKKTPQPFTRTELHSKQGKSPLVL